MRNIVAILVLILFSVGLYYLPLKSNIAEASHSTTGAGFFTYVTDASYPLGPQCTGGPFLFCDDFTFGGDAAITIPDPTKWLNPVPGSMIANQFTAPNTEGCIANINSYLEAGSLVQVLTDNLSDACASAWSPSFPQDGGWWIPNGSYNPISANPSNVGMLQTRKLIGPPVDGHPIITEWKIWWASPGTHQDHSFEMVGYLLQSQTQDVLTFSFFFPYVLLSPGRWELDVDTAFILFSSDNTNTAFQTHQVTPQIANRFTVQHKLDVIWTAPPGNLWDSGLQHLDYIADGVVNFCSPGDGGPNTPCTITNITVPSTPAMWYYWIATTAPGGPFPQRQSVDYIRMCYGDAGQTTCP